MTARQVTTLTILYVYCTGGTECLSHTPGSHSVCAIRLQLEVDQKIFSVRKEPMLSGFLTLNAQARGILGLTPGDCRITACMQK